MREENMPTGGGGGEEGGVTRGRSMRTCIPSPGPMWATWLKFVGLEIIFDRSSGSLNISLNTAINTQRSIHNDQYTMINTQRVFC